MEAANASRPLVIGGLVILAWMQAGSARAQDVYKGPDPGTGTDPTSGRWFPDANWVGGTAPGSDRDTSLRFRSGTTSYTARNDFAGGFQLNRLNFSAGDSTRSVTLSGEKLQFSKNRDDAEPAIARTGDFDPNAPALVSQTYNITNAVEVDNGATLRYLGSGNRQTVIGDQGNEAMGVIGGRGALRVASDEGTSIALFGKSTYSGGTTLDSGILVVGNQSGAALGTGPLTINGGQITADRDQGRNVSAQVKVTVAGDAKYGSSNYSATLSFKGPATLSGGDRTFTVLRPPGQPLLPNGQADRTGGRVIAGFAGVMGDGGDQNPQAPKLGIVKDGPGKMLLSNNNTYRGATTVKGGTLVVNGAIGQIAGGAGQVTVEGKGSLLMGTGTIFTDAKPVGTVGVTIKPSSAVKGGNSPGKLTLNGGLELEPGAILLADLDGPEPVTGYSQLHVLDGGTRLDGSVLDPALNDTPGEDDAFYLIRNDGNLWFSGMFANTFRIGSRDFIDLAVSTSGHIYRFAVSTTGDFDGANPSSLTGNDVVLFDPKLISVPEPSALVLMTLGAAAVGLIGRRRRAKPVP